MNELVKVQKELQAELESAKKEYSNFRADFGDNAKDKPGFPNEINVSNIKAIDNLTEELGFFNGSYGFFGFLKLISISDYSDSYLFVTLPSEVLVMTIVLAMGTLGSMISITQVFFTREYRPFTFYLFRPLLGAIVAIGIYVITKAGVIVATNLPIESGGTAKLNAFFISFISLIAGMMSEAAVDSIKTAGNGFFRGDNVNERARFARSLLKKIEDKEKDKSDLYSMFPVSKDVIDEWLSERSLIPSDAQKIIAAWLGMSVRELFTDLPMPEKNEKEISSENAAAPRKRSKAKLK